MDGHTQDPWTEAQWTQVQETVRDEARKQRVAASFLPVYGPLPPEDQNATLQSLNISGAGPWGLQQEIDDFTTRRLTTLSVNVSLRQAQVVEPDLAGALVAFRRAANLIARAEDYLVFRGQPGVSAGIPASLAPCTVTGGTFFLGLVDEASAANLPVLLGLSPTSNQLIVSISQAIGILEQQGHLGPFALVLGTQLFDLALTPDVSLVLPADRIKPLIDGPLLRSSTLNWFMGGTLSTGLLVSLADELLDLVVASEIGARYIQTTAGASTRHIFRVSQRFTLRVKQPTAMVALRSWW